MKFLLALLLAAPASAQMTPAPMAMPACPATPAPPPAGWTAALPVAAAESAEGATMLSVGKGAVATLVPASAITFPVTPVKPQGAASRGGVFAFSVAEAGRYRVALGGGVWVDVIGDGKALASVAHGHGPACSPVRKTVDFDLKPGRYLVQVMGSDAPTLALMVAKLN